ncbi:MAG: segregation and condensation protein [Patescibacteria group bacterium]|nr:segregation and condensation protein [Patescibacteria group bacterium]
MENAFKVKTSSFEGPFNLLLSLVEERKLFINDVSLASVTEDFLKYMNALGNLGHNELAAFISVASTLILIKSKSLLPNLELTEEEQGDISSLEERLRLYDLYTKLGINIKNNFGEKIIFAPNERKSDILIFLPDNKITKDSMMTFASDVLGRIPKKVFLPEIEVKKVISIEEMIDKLTERISNTLSMNFKEFAGGSKTKEEKVFVIVGFLAVLELSRQGILNLIQENNFEDIIIEKQEIIIESYE